MKRRLLSVAFLVTIAGALGLIWWYFSAPQQYSENPVVEAEITPSIRGHILDSTGQPIAGASVELGDDRRVKTGVDGSFIFDNLKAGTYRVGAQAEGFLAGGPPGLKTVEVTLSTDTNGSSVRDLRLILQRVGSISGRVVAAGRAVSDASVSIYYKSAQGLNDTIDPYVVDAAATTDASGKFEISNLAPGRLQLLIEAPDYALAESRHLLVEPAEAVGPIVIDLAPSATIVGEVLNTDGEPVKARIVLRANDPSAGRSRRNRRSRANESGRFSFRNIPAGRYTIKAVAAGFRDTLVEDVVAVVGEVSSHELVMEPGDGIFGRVLGPGGAPVARAFVVFREADSTNRRAWKKRVRTNRDGLFQWNDPPDGAYVATAVSPHHADSKPKSMRRSRSNTLALGAGGAISGRVVGPRGQAVQSFSIGVGSFESTGPIAFSTRAAGIEKVNDSTGTFRLDALRPGKYWLQVQSTDFAPATSEQVVVQRGAEANGLIIQLGQAGRVAGTVRNAKNDQPVAGARVAVFEPGSPFSANSTRTDKDGNFSIEGVAPGRRSLRVTKKGFLTTVAAGLEVSQAQQASRNITISPRKPGERLQFQGIGAMLSKQDGGVRVRKVFDGHPASQFGLKANDFIRNVDGRSVDELPLSRVVEKIRGQQGVPVKLQVERPGEGRLTLEIERRKVIVK